MIFSRLFILVMMIGAVSCSQKKVLLKNDDSESVKDYTKVVKGFISNVKSKNVSRLSENTFYPLRRELPLPAVENSEDFTERFSEIFDATLIEMIAASDPKTDWDPVGSRGIMLNNGSVWIDYSGRLTAVNYESEVEKIKRLKLQERIKLNLHSSVMEFEKNMLEMETEGYRLRVDDLGNYKFRLAMWRSPSQTNEEPSDIAYDGERIFDGSGGNHRYLFKSGNNSYEVHVTPLGVKYPATFVLFDEEMMKTEQGALKFKR